jgi:hypothetical protein
MMTKSNKTVFELVAQDFDHNHTHCTTQSMLLGSTSVDSSFLVGGGKENYDFMSLKQLVATIMAVVDSGEFALPFVRLTKGGKSYEIDLSALRRFEPTGKAPKIIRFVKAKEPSKNVSVERLMAHELANVMLDDLFLESVHALFAQDRKTLIEDRNLHAPEYREMVDSLAAQLLPAQDQVVAALPMVMDQLRSRYPDASTGQLYQAALQLIGQQLSPILSTIQMWTTGLRQALDPALKDKLRIVRAIVESNLFLALTGNLKIDEIGSKEEIKQLIPTINVSVGDVVLPVLIGPFDSGPAVIPMASGALGPRGGHLAFIPWNLLKRLPFIVPIYGHETGHLLQAVIKNYMQTYTKLAVDTIKKALADGTLVLDEMFIMIGNQKIPAEIFWPMVFMGQLTEQDADHWSDRAVGPAAFISSFVIYMGAMTEVGRGDMDKVDHVLRSGSSYTVVQTKDGKTQIRLEPHPQDFPRIGSWNAAIADELGYPEQGVYARAYADSEAGTPVPTRITWAGQMPKGGDQDDSLVDTKTTGKKTSERVTRSQAPIPGKAPATKKKAPAKTKPSGKVEGTKAKTPKSAPKPAPAPAPKQPQLPTISASYADYDKIAKLVVKAHLDTPTDCLNGMTLRELVNLTPKMHFKVDDVRKKLAAGDGKLSDDYHTFLLTVGAAYCEEYFAQCKAGGKPDEVADRLMKPAMEMMLTITDLWEADVKRLDVYGLEPKDVQPKTMVKTKKS